MSAADVAEPRAAVIGADHESARFVAYVAHELRTPLATQRALLELALADLDADADAWREIGEDVLDACRQQERLLDACLGLFRSQSGPYSRETLDLAAIVAERLGAGDLGGLTVRSRLDRALTIGDPDLVERLVENLLVNAVRHNRAGGWIAITTRRSGASALFAVANTGPLIPAGEVTRLFEPFQQLTGRNAPPAGGLGLGLAVAKAVADAHDALVTAHARRARGLRVMVAFPAANR
jgi:signal transduction histidine kinase